MRPIKYVKGDATQPEGVGMRLVIHCCNNRGQMGSGVALAIAKKWRGARDRYIQWYTEIQTDVKKAVMLPLGMVQFVTVESHIVVGNMIGQNGTISKENPTPIDYAAIRSCLGKVRQYVGLTKASVHAPKFGAGLAGGNWETIEKIIQEELSVHSIPVTIYEFEQPEKM